MHIWLFRKAVRFPRLGESIGAGAETRAGGFRALGCEVVPGGHVPRDDKFLDLGGALVELKDFGVAHQLLYRVLHVESGAPEDLHRVGADLVAVVAGEYLGHACEHGVGPPAVDLVGALVSQQPRRLDAGRHVRQHKGDHLVVENGRAHGDPLPRVLDGLVHGPPRNTHRPRGHGRPRVVEGPHGNLEARPLGPEHVGRGHHHLVEKKWTGIRAALSHVHQLFAHRDAWRVCVNNESGHALARAFLLRVGHRQHEVPPALLLGDAAVGDP
mmetsp:Transcript_13521/g.20427  ORF Transcript_13521/g.20427 Transcript_13521/m.20427 type:complete len:270 (+) Transcript_13521:69-878(+)